MELTFRMQIHLKKIDVSQLHDLRDISILTFKETFEDQNTPENMQWYFENTMNIDHIQEELLNPDSSFYFAYNQNQTIGYLKLNFNNAQTENVLKNNGFEIERIYIKKEFQGNGFGSELFSIAINLGIKKGCNQLWLGVWEHNYKALAFYKKKGLIAFDHHVFQLGDDPQTDILMYLKF
ncbi:GNAT family N-acetyltransferase [Flavobacteriaceae bacterium]|nr:GNAT family N-acetyltransferase [Flavobacteriaceae bacterium]